MWVRRTFLSPMEEISQFERLLTSISLRLEDVSGESVVPEIRWALEEIAAYFGVQRILLTEFQEKPGILPFFIYWSRPGIIPSSPETVAPLLDSWYHRTMKSGEIVRLSDVFEDLPPECETERVFCRRMGIKSVLTVPLRFQGRVACALSLNAVDAPIAWADRTVERAGAIGQVLANVIYRKQAEESLRQNLEEIQKLKEHLEAETRYLRAGGAASRRNRGGHREEHGLQVVPEPRGPGRPHRQHRPPPRRDGDGQGGPRQPHPPDGARGTGIPS